MEFQYEGIVHGTAGRTGEHAASAIHRAEASEEDKERYQTVYCEEGSVAAPTAGLHFTDELLGKAKRKGRGTGLCDASCWDRYVPACQVRTSEEHSIRILRNTISRGKCRGDKTGKTGRSSSLFR